MSSRTLLSVLGLGALAAAAIAPLAPAAPAQAADGTVCTVSDGTLTWGFKESFRSYISGSIANGSWEAMDGATYETPVFTWSGAHGEIDAAGHGEISFTGSVLFTGHGGLLQTTIAEPVLVLDDAGAHLSLDITGVSMDDALAGGEVTPEVREGVPFAALELPALDWAAPQIAAVDIPATVTAEGFEAFGSYEAGTPLDPISIALTSTCETEKKPAEETTAPVDDTTDAAFDAPGADGGSADDGSWVPWAIGGAAVFIVAAGATALLVRRRGAGSGEASDAAHAPDDAPGGTA
ncbi:hypothetical protein GCM10025768_26930 [Microbacterium pseudoresistens]